MELTPERKKQIEDEERQRLAEEEYRAQLRANLRTAAAQPAASGPERHKSGAGWMVAITLLVVVVSAILYGTSRTRTTDSDTPSRPAREPSNPRTRYVPVTQQIASGQVVVKASGYVQYRIQITPDMRDARITGSFNASGGSGNDIAAVIASESEFTNWINGHGARAFYSSEGKKTTDGFDVRLGPGTYIFAMSNQFSALSDKYVFVEAKVNYNRLETY